jgi:hypothetical protein
MNMAFSKSNERARDVYKDQISDLLGEEDQKKLATLRRKKELYEKALKKNDDLSSEKVEDYRKKLAQTKIDLEKIEKDPLEELMSKHNSINYDLMTMTRGKKSFNGKFSQKQLQMLADKGYTFEDIQRFLSTFKSGADIQKFNAERLDWYNEEKKKDKLDSSIPTVSSQTNLISDNYGLTPKEAEKKKKENAAKLKFANKEGYNQRYSFIC